MILQYYSSKYEDEFYQLVNHEINDYVDTITIDKNTKYQKIIGFGGAFTEATAYTLKNISANHRDDVITSYYNKGKGNNYILGRIHMNSCDFSLENYDNVEEFDTELIKIFLIFLNDLNM